MTGHVSPGLFDPDRAHLALLTPRDRAWVDDIYGNRTPDPGRLSMDEISALSERERERYAIRRTHFLRMTPLVQTTIVAGVMGPLGVMARSAIRSDLHQQDIPILNGEPGVGKTMILKTHAAMEMHRLALHRSLELEDGTVAPVETFRPVVFVHLRGPMTRYDVIRLICDELAWPSDRNPLRAFERAVEHFDLQLVIIDEIQHVNFDGKTGRDVHNIIRWMTNHGLRVILAGTAVDWVLQGSNHGAISVAARNSRGRWVRLDVPRLTIDTPDGLDEWLNVIDEFAGRLRLANAPSDPRWLSDEFGEYLWARTQGYFNSLVLLLNLASAAAIQSGLEAIDRDLLDSCTLEYEVERQRPRVMANLNATQSASGGVDG